MAYKMSQKLKTRIRQLLVESWTVNSIADELDVTFDDVRKVLAEAIAEDLRTGLFTQVQIADSWNVTRGLVQKIAKDLRMGKYDARETLDVDTDEVVCKKPPVTVDGLYEQIDKLRTELDIERVRLAGCGVIAMSNTRAELAKQFDGIHPYYDCASLQDVKATVLREIELREENESLRDKLKEANNLIEVLKTENRRLGEQLNIPMQPAKVPNDVSLSHVVQLAAAFASRGDAPYTANSNAVDLYEAIETYVYGDGTQ